MHNFFINNYRVDTDRRQIILDGECISLEPKVSKVLYFLAQHQGEVVSHQTLLDAFWTNTIVEPGALQRCIARLRKVFNDDARKQAIIATYPKQGYSLVADVRWETTPEPALPTAWFVSRQMLAESLAMASLLIAAVILIPLIGNGPQAVASGNAIAALPNQSLLNNSALLEAIGNPDDFPVYSPDGRYVVYPRYLEDSKAHLWARDLAYGNDFLLTEEAGMYEHLAWSHDGSRLVFVDATCQSEQCNAGSCSSLKTVAVSQSETNALFVEKLIDCSPYHLLAPEWINNKLLAYIELGANEARLVQFDLKTFTSTPLLLSTEQIPYHLSYSRQTNILTIMTINPDGQKELLFVDRFSGTININDTTVIGRDENWYPSSTPL